MAECCDAPAFATLAEYPDFTVEECVCGQTRTRWAVVS